MRTMILVWSNLFECHVGHLKQTVKQMKNTKLGDIIMVDGKRFEVVSWYYYYLTLKPISKLRILINKLKKQLWKQ